MRWYDYGQLLFGCLGFIAFQLRDVVGWVLGALTAMTLIYIGVFRRNAQGFNLFGTVGGIIFVIYIALDAIRH